MQSTSTGSMTVGITIPALFCYSNTTHSRQNPEPGSRGTENSNLTVLAGSDFTWVSEKKARAYIPKK